MKTPKELLPEEVYRFADLSSLGFKTTEQLSQCQGFIGQERAVKAIHFGLGIRHRGYNLYLAGPAGVGKSSVIRAILSDLAATKPTPWDWCYVHNFHNPSEPKTLSFPTGTAKNFRKDMEDLLEMLKINIPKSFESKQYEETKQKILNDSQRLKTSLFDEVQRKAAQSDVQTQFSPTGIVTIPLMRGKPITQEEFNNLDEASREDLRRRKETVDEEVAELFKRARKQEKDDLERIKELEKKVALFAVRDILDSVRDKYKSYPEVIDYMNMMQRHILENIDVFLPDKPEANIPVPFRTPQQKPTFSEYQVNVLIDNSATSGAPVIFESNPTYINLVGSIEREVRFGILVTDFTMIHPGSIAKANGGYLVLEAADVLRYPMVWDTLKKTLANGELRIEDVYQQYGFVNTAGVKPEPIKVNLKVVLTGSSHLYHLLYAYDEDFRKLFKVKADFDSTVEATDGMLSKYACFIKSSCDTDGLRQFTRSGVEAVVEHCARLAGDRDKLSIQFGAILKILREADYWAEADGASSYVSREHVEQAIREKINRSNMVEEKIQETMEKGVIMIDVEGEVVGQINGLAVYNMGDYSFGKPSRITCETFMGSEGVANIERKARLSGNIHDKGVLILSGYLGSKYAQDKPLSLSASLGFEQSYDMIDGDSASTAELVAIISSLASTAIKQQFAITGSVNQKGQIQPIGGVNEKIEGFFQVCKARGLTGAQGVLIPHQNARNLMLGREVVEAVREGKFHIYPMETVDDAIEILTGNEAGERGAKGEFTKASVHYLVDKRLREFGEQAKKHGRAKSAAAKSKGREEEEE
ncbi:MAG: Lon protease family protein [Deltaproteobacteria bacterium]